MRYARPISLASLALFALAGCRTGGVNDFSRQTPVAARPEIDVQTLITAHNRNAERVERLEARPSLSMKRLRTGGAADGFLALERPRNFRLEIRHTAGEIADLGSNDEKFWYWTKNDRDKKVYFCNYDAAGRSPISPATLQPEWIVQALGMQVIGTTEAAGYTITRGDTPDTLVLTHSPTHTGGETVTRVLVFTESTRRIKEHRLYTGEPKTLIAQAVVDEYFEVPLTDRPDEQVYLPKRLRINWARDQVNLDVRFAAETTKVNAEFAESALASLFQEDERVGYERQDLAAGLPFQEGASSIRETRPAPPTHVRMGDPVPVGVDGAMRTEYDPTPVAPADERRLSLRDGLVGPALPTAPDSKYEDTPKRSARWRPLPPSGE